MLKKERNYEFRDRLRTLHRKNIRDYAVKATADETEIGNGWQVIMPADYSEVVYTAVQDFQDYLFTSMKVSVMAAEDAGDCRGENCESGAIFLKVVPVMSEDYVIDVRESIEIKGKNDRALAQALYCLEDRMNRKKAPIFVREVIRHTFMYSPRMIHSGYGLGEFPNEHLSAIAHAGMDAIMVFIKGINRTLTGFLDFNDLIARAARYGIDVYAYSNMVIKVHPDEDGAQKAFDSVYGSLFEACPGFKGLILVGEDLDFPSDDPHVAPRDMPGSKDGIPCGLPRPGWWPCYDFPKFLECVKKSVRSVKPEADIIFWTYNWGYVEEEARLVLINSLPTDITLQATYEMFEEWKAESCIQTCADYSLSFAGPGNYFTSELKAAAERGIRFYAMTNTGGMAWDMGTIPYEPMPYQWMKRYQGMREAHDRYGLCGIMESHHYGIWPSFISDLAKQCFIEENTDMEECLKNVVIARFVDKAEGAEEKAAKICEALKCFSEAICHYTPSDADQYGAFRIGPSYPLCLIKEIKPPAAEYSIAGSGIVEVSYPADYNPTNTLPTGRGMLPSLRLEGEIASLKKMLAYMEEGVAILKEVEEPNQELLYLINLGEYICCYVTTGIHAKEWYDVTSRLKIEKDVTRLRELIVSVKDVIRRERENAQKAIPLVEKDSRLGFEPTMHYLTDAEHIRWKLRHLDYVESFEVKCFENGSADRWFR